MRIQRLLKIVSISDVKDGKNGPYMVVKFEPKYMFDDGTPVATALSEGTRTVFGPSQIDGKEVKADGLFKSILAGQVKEGHLVEGQLTRVVTTPYYIPGREKAVTQWTGVIFAHETARDYVNKQFASAKVPACVIEGDNLTAPENLNVPLEVHAGAFKPMEVPVEDAL